MGYLFCKPIADFDLHIKMINGPSHTRVKVIIIENVGFQKMKIRIGLMFKPFQKFIPVFHSIDFFPFNSTEIRPISSFKPESVF